MMGASDEDAEEDGSLVKGEAEPQLFMCDDWSAPVEVMKRPCSLQSLQDKLSLGKEFFCWSLSCP